MTPSTEDDAILIALAIVLALPALFAFLAAKQVEPGLELEL